MASNTHFKFIEWRDTAGLYKDTNNTILDLKFSKDELRFLEGLVSEHTLELIYGKNSEESKAIIKELTEHSKRLDVLMTKLNAHSKELKVFVDEDDNQGELQFYKNEHYTLLLEEMDFHADLKKTKRQIFKMLSEIMKKSKQKQLPDK